MLYCTFFAETLKVFDGRVRDLGLGLTVPSLPMVSLCHVVRLLILIRCFTLSRVKCLNEKVQNNYNIYLTCHFLQDAISAQSQLI